MLSPRSLSLGIADLCRGIARRQLWMMLGSQDIRQRYRRSRLGPFWLTISLGFTVGALGFLYGTLFNQPIDDYLPYLAAGFVVWGLISGLINDGTRAFIDSEGLIKQLSAPLSIYVYRSVWSNALIFLHNILVFFLVVLIFSKPLSWTLLLVAPGLALLLLNGVWAALLLGLVSARFRDVPQIISSLVQVMFFVTPVLWTTEMLPDRALLLELNPFFYFVELVRAPLLGSTPELRIWLIGCTITAIGWIAAIAVYAAYRWRIAYWL